MSDRCDFDLTVTLPEIQRLFVIVGFATLESHGHPAIERFCCARLAAGGGKGLDSPPAVIGADTM